VDFKKWRDAYVLEQGTCSSIFFKNLKTDDAARQTSLSSFHFPTILDWIPFRLGIFSQPRDPCWTTINSTLFITIITMKFTAAAAVLALSSSAAAFTGSS
jgi:hypothetical protein